jgi:hypothetical protein
VQATHGSSCKIIILNGRMWSECGMAALLVKPMVNLGARQPEVSDSG